MNRRETWYLLILLLFVGGIVYLLENKPSDSASPADQTPTIAPVWTIAANTVQSVRFEDLKNGQFVDLVNNAGKWSVINYSLVTPTLTPLPTSTTTATLASGITPSPTATSTNTNTPTVTPSPTATLAISLTPTLPPTLEAEMEEWTFMLGQMESIVPEKVLGDNLKAKDFGLDAPNYKLTLKMTDGKVATLLIGAATPVKGSGYYAQVSGYKTFYLLPANLIDALIGYLTTPPTVKTPTPEVTATLEPTASFTLTQTPTLTPTLTPTINSTSTTPTTAP